MAYNRVWFDRDRYALTLGGGKINNPGRHLVLLPPINGATAASGTPYFTGPEGVTPPPEETPEHPTQSYPDGLPIFATAKIASPALCS
jgi:hypothetical protein